MKTTSMRMGTEMEKFSIKFIFTNILLLLIVFATSGCRPNSRSPIERKIERVENGLRLEINDPWWKRMDLFKRMDYHNVPGVSITVINDYQIEWSKAYGLLEAGETTLVSPETLFQPASPSKVIVAVTALHFVEKGILDIDTDVNEYLESWKIPENPFTTDQKVSLRRILSHNAGLTVSGFRGYSIGEDIPTLLQILDGESPANSDPIRVYSIPGTEYEYSGGGYMVVQQLLEDVVGEPLPFIIQKSVLEPWGMASTTFESPLPGNWRSIAASGHRSDGSPIRGGWHTYPEAGAGASTWSTSIDMAIFAIKLMEAYQGRSDEVLSHEMAALMMTPQIEERGLGPVVLDDGGDLFYFLHPGANDGYKSIMVGYPERGQGVVILTNSDNGDLLWREILNSLSVEYGWVQNNSILYAAILALIVIAMSVFILVRRQRTINKRR